MLTMLLASQPLSLLLKLCPLVDELALYDVVNTPGVATDLSHISSNAVCPASQAYHLTSQDGHADIAMCK